MRQPHSFLAPHHHLFHSSYSQATSTMDALLSLPLLSAVLLPTYMSYSTQLNLLFFYLTWSSLILSYSSLKVEFIGTLFIRLVFYLIPSYAFLLFDAAIPSIAVNIKQHGETAIATNREHRKGQWWRVASLSTFNVVLGIAIQIGVEFLFINVLHIRSALKITTTLPLPWGIAKDIAKGFLFREVCSNSKLGINF